MNRLRLSNPLTTSCPPRSLRAASSLTRAVFAFALMGALAASGCGDGGGQSQLSRTCSAVCDRLAACDANSGQSAAECVQTCHSQAPIGGTCAATASSADACIGAVEATSCGDLQSSPLPSACLNVCAASAPDAGPTDVFTSDTAGGTGGACAELADCCGEIDDANARQGCDGLVSIGNEIQCQGGLASYRVAGFCS